MCFIHLEKLKAKNTEQKSKYKSKVQRANKQSKINIGQKKLKIVTKRPISLHALHGFFSLEIVIEK